jgi:hypothetical protein
MATLHQTTVECTYCVLSYVVTTYGTSTPGAGRIQVATERKKGRRLRLLFTVVSHTVRNL